MIRVVFKALSRLLHRTGRPGHHALLFRTNLWMAWRTRHERRGAFGLGRFATDGAVELLKLLLALTGLPGAYRTLDRRRRRHCKPRLSELDARTQEAVQLFISSLDTGSLPTMSRAILYGSRARGDHRDDSDVDIMLVFAGSEPDYDTQVQVCNAMADAQHQTNDALQAGVEVTSFVYWQDEFDNPDKQRNPDFYHNVLADGVDVTFLTADQSISKT